jgi:restriction endonuclease Mrr
MAVAASNDCPLSVLIHTADGAEHTVSELADTITRHYALMQQDLAENLPSGAQNSARPPNTTSRFSKDAEEFAHRIPQTVVLIDGDKKLNLECFGEE